MSAWSTKVPKKGDGGEDRYVPEEGNHPAILVGLIDLGTHTESYNGQKPHDSRKILLVWELAGVKIPGTSIPVTIGRDYTYSLSEKAHLRSLIKAWRGKDLGEGEDFDLSKLLGQPCLVNVSHKTAKESGNSYGIVSGVSGWRGPMVKEMKAPVASIKPAAWTFSDGPYPAYSWVPFMCAMGEVKEVIADAKENRDETRGGGETPPPERHTSRPATQEREDEPSGTEGGEEEIPF